MTLLDAETAIACLATPSANKIGDNNFHVVFSR
jgi:hypothetical protein